MKPVDWKPSGVKLRMSVFVIESETYVCTPSPINGDIPSRFNCNGMLHVGIGETQVNNLFSTMNVHYPHHKTLKTRENEVGNVMERQATNSEHKSLLDEAFQAMTIDAGVATLIGVKNKKVVRHSIRCKGCRICTNEQKKVIPPSKHKCAKNWTRSAKGMEPDMMVEMIKDLNNRGVKFKELAGDDDSTGFKKASKLLPHSQIVKSSDRNHIMVNASKKLFSNKLKHKELSAMVINSILKNYSYTLSQNQGNPEGIVNGVRGMIDHMYGKHDKCDIKWCGYLKIQLHTGTAIYLMEKSVFTSS
ncbi:unnamed protein product [Mytilus coruscus]|uniref:Mutator-like transposase domain-containing protein n=1 Tax=Mytilus coruscus TaxID=42192 RepID=A0A6J8AYW2_MYTCO|nr:unnamed protein product [Mytilus coruscus]